jgi:hypothetical protein
MYHHIMDAKWGKRASVIGHSYSRDLETSNNPVALLYILHLRPDLINDPHPLVTQDLAWLQLHDLLVIEVQIASSDSSASDLDYGVGGLGDGGHRHLFDPHILVTIPAERQHSFVGPRRMLVRRGGGAVAEPLFYLVGNEGVHLFAFVYDLSVIS